MRNRLPSTVEEKCDQLPDYHPNILVVVAPPEIQFDEFEDFFIDIPTTQNLDKGLVTGGKPKGFFYQELVDGTKIHTKLSAVVMWKDYGCRYLINPNAKFTVSEELLRKMTP